MPNAAVSSTESMAAQYPRAAEVVQQMRAASTRILAGQVDLLIAQRGEAFWQRAERLVRLADALGGSPVKALLEYTVAYLKEQARFMATDAYTQTDFDAVVREVYDNPEIMEGFYLQGLMLTHAFWPIHFDIHDFFCDAFLPRVPDCGCGAEFGFGHGLYLAEVLTARPHTTTISYDISRYSQAYAGRLLASAGIAAERFDLRLADVRQPLPPATESCDWLIFAEVLEHIPDPAFALRELRRCLKPGAPLFVTTVIDSNAIDHLYRFEDVSNVREMIAQSGLSIVAERSLAIRDYAAAARDPSVDVVLVCERTP